MASRRQSKKNAKKELAKEREVNTSDNNTKRTTGERIEKVKQAQRRIDGTQSYTVERIKKTEGKCIKADAKIVFEVGEFD